MGDIRTYSELCQIKTFEDRFKYLCLHGEVGKPTFDWLRYLNQHWYTSKEWRDIKREVIIRDCGCDLGVEGFTLFESIYIHHMNPITDYDVIHMTDYLTSPEYLISTSFNTHNAIHYGDLSNITKIPIVRSPNDTCPWRKD